MVKGHSRDSPTQAVCGGRSQSAQSVFHRSDGDLLKNAFLLVTDFFIMLLVLLFLFKDGPQWWTACYDLIPMDASHKYKIVTRLDQTIRAVVKGMLVTAIVRGALAGSAYVGIGRAVPGRVDGPDHHAGSAAPPRDGPGLGTGCTVSLHGPVNRSGIDVLAWGVGVLSTVDQILKPYLIGQDVQVPTLLLVLSVLGGLALYGLVGLFVGILVSLLTTAVQIYREEYQTAVPPSSVSPPAPV